MLLTAKPSLQLLRGLFKNNTDRYMGLCTINRGLSIMMVCAWKRAYTDREKLGGRKIEMQKRKEIADV